MNNILPPISIRRPKKHSYRCISSCRTDYYRIPHPSTNLLSIILPGKTHPASKSSQ